MSLSPEDITLNRQTLFRKLLYYIPNPYGVSAIMGNIYKESWNTFDPRIVQGFNAGTFDFCITYTNRVDSGEITKDKFVNEGPNGGGYGLVQWTYPARKRALYELKVSDNYYSIGSLDLQVRYLNQELSGYAVKTSIDSCTYDSIGDVAEQFCWEFERPDPAAADVPTRRSQAYNIYEECKDLTPLAPGDEPVPPTPPVPTVKRSRVPIWLIDKIVRKEI